MPTAAKTRRKRSKGSIEELPSGALRVAVYAGLDPLTEGCAVAVGRDESSGDRRPSE